MTKPFVVNPWMLDQADRLASYASLRGMSAPTKSSWGYLEGFRRADQDVDRSPGNWLEGWSSASRLSLANAKDRRHSRSGLVSVALQDLVSCSHPNVVMTRFERDDQGGLDKKLASHLIEAREAGKQAWISLPPLSFPLPLAMDGALKLGAAWWCTPPKDRCEWDEFAKSQAHWGENILKSPHWDQWVWPWSSMIEQGLLLCLQGVRPTASRFSPPEGWRDRRPAAWGSLGMVAWQSAQEISQGGWEDLWIGLLVDRLAQPGNSCE